MSIFIGGSRAVSRLNAQIRDRLEDFVRRSDAILIGDANGADKAVQQYLAERAYPHVTVFCIEQCRNNIGSWPTRHITPPSDRKNFSYYASKAAVMAQEAKCGMMLWDAKSKGTLQNMLKLVAPASEHWFTSRRQRIFMYWRPSRICRRSLLGVKAAIWRRRRADLA